MARAPRKLRLSTRHAELSSSYEAVVVGSGYGGSVAAYHLAQKLGGDVLLLERGAERWPGEYPDEILEAAGHLQLNTPVGRWGQLQDMFEFHINDGMSALVGSGLGGTSLINANVVLGANSAWQDSWLPATVREDPGAWQAAEARARAMLDVSPYPSHFPRLPKLEAMMQAQPQLGSLPVQTPDLAINFAPNPTPVDAGRGQTFQRMPCVGCGDCVSGCNYWAKNTLLMNYLPAAARAGCTIATRAQARLVSKTQTPERPWAVEVQLYDADGDEAGVITVVTQVVVLAAGSLGSTEILLRSRERGLECSDRLGRGFSGNGDHLAFAYNCDQEIRGVGTGAAASGEPPVGPCITAMVDARDGDGGFLVQEGSIPSPIALVAAEAIRLARWGGTDMDRGDYWEEAFRRLARADIDNTQVLLAMGEDQNDGRLVLDAADNLRIEWDIQPRNPNVDQVFETITKAWGGTMITDLNSVLTLGYSRGFITVHPLGGCTMADDAEHGVTNGDGEVFQTSGTTVHDGLYVMDGAVVPRATTVNPLLTISTIAERNAPILVHRHFV